MDTSKSTRANQIAEKIAEFLKDQAKQGNPTTHKVLTHNGEETWTYAKKDQILPQTKDSNPEEDAVSLQPGFFFLTKKYKINENPYLSEKLG